jgi:ElaB/YqjD/DUF883 family membrane-anchored ribosome-binding protein
LNPNFYEAFYMRAGFAAMLGDPITTTRSLETAVRGDARYHERAKTDPIFDNVRPDVRSLIDRLLHDIQDEAARARQSIENLYRRHGNLLPEGTVRMSKLFEAANKQLALAGTYRDYYEFIKLPKRFESELHQAEQNHSAKKHEVESRVKNAISSIESKRESQRQSKAEAAKGAALFAIILVPVWSLAHCFTSVHMRTSRMPPPLGDVFPPAFFTAIMVSIGIIILAYIFAGRSEGKDIVEKEQELERLRGELRRLT